MSEKNTLDSPFGEYYKTWVHWHLREYELFGGGYWPERWALVPLWSFLVGILFLHPMGKIISLFDVNWRELAWGEEENTFLVMVAKILYRLYDKVKVVCVDKFAVFFVNEQAKWPPPDMTYNPAVTADREETGAKS